MIDSLIRLLPNAVRSLILDELGLESRHYAVLTLHRPTNVDDRLTLFRLLKVLADLSLSLPIIFPIHPRTRQRINDLDLVLPGTLRLIDPLGYLDFLRLVSQSRLVLTDSGGIQEETSYLGIPCLTLRSNTERPITVTMGTNMLVGNDFTLLRRQFKVILRSWETRSTSDPIPLWDGHAAERIADILLAIAEGRAGTWLLHHQS